MASFAEPRHCCCVGPCPLHPALGSALNVTHDAMASSGAAAAAEVTAAVAAAAVVAAVAAAVAAAAGGAAVASGHGDEEETGDGAVAECGSADVAVDAVDAAAAARP